MYNEQIIDCEKGRPALIIGSGSSIREYKEQILGYIEDTGCFTIGINCMTSLCTPDYHLWTNRKQFSTLRGCIKKPTTLLLGEGIGKSLIPKGLRGKYVRINYVDEPDHPVKIEDGAPMGYFRTAGVLAIMLAHLMGAADIDIVGMDGYTLYDEREVKDKKKNQHCYGKGHTDDANWKECLRKDNAVYEALRSINNFGIKFGMLTPTKFKEFYRGFASS